MKVIFLQDVPNIAKAGDTKQVPDGYGRNYLIPRHLAVLADSNATNVVERQRKLQAKFEAAQQSVAKQLDSREITLKVRTGAEDKLFGSVTAADIAQELQQVSGIEIDKRKVVLAEPIKSLGSYEVEIKLAKDASAKIKVNLVATEASQGEQQREAAAA